MKFLKQKNISKFSINDNTLFANQYGRAIMDLTGALRLPKGSTSQRPELTGVRIPNGPNGYIRYNTSIDSVTGAQIGLEALIDGYWEIIRAPGAATITKQTLGPGDDVETTFGPLLITPDADDNILVLVENVFQISVTNFNLSYNYSGSGDTYIEFTSPVPLDKNVTIYFGFSN
jgi:hypothetical protein